MKVLWNTYFQIYLYTTFITKTCTLKVLGIVWHHWQKLLLKTGAFLSKNNVYADCSTYNNLSIIVDYSFLKEISNLEQWV